MSFFQGLKQQSKEVKTQAKQQTLSFLVAALGLVAGLAWNEAIKDLIDKFFPMGRDSVLAKFFYAILVTLLVVTLTIYLTRLFSNKNEN